MPSAALQSYFWPQGDIEPPVPVAGGATVRFPRPTSDHMTFWSIVPFLLLNTFTHWR